MFRPTPRKSLAPAPHSSRAFTLVELLTVVAIIGVLAAIIIPTVGKMQESSRRSQCSSNLRQIGVAFNLYAADNRGLYPAPRKTGSSDTPVPAPWANPSGDNWLVEISPYVIRKQNLGEVKRTGAASNISHCPSYDLLFPDTDAIVATQYRTAGYGMNFNINVGGVSLNSTVAGVVMKNRRFLAGSINHPASTVLVGDSSDYQIDKNGGSWTKIEEDPAKPDGYGSGAPTRHGSNANYLFVDGHVASLSPDEALVALRYRP